MKPSREDILNRSEDTGDGWVRMPFSDWGATMDFLRILERFEEVMLDPFGDGPPGDGEFGTSEPEKSDVPN